MNKTNAETFLRWGLAFVFFYVAIASMIDPANWSVYNASIVRGFVSDRIFFTLFGVYQLFLAAWLFSGRKTSAAAIASMATLVVIMAANFFSFDAVFGDVGLVMAALALFELTRKNS